MIYSDYKAGQNVHGAEASKDTYDLHEQKHRKVLWGSTQFVAYHYTLLTCISGKQTQHLTHTELTQNNANQRSQTSGGSIFYTLHSGYCILNYIGFRLPF